MSRIAYVNGRYVPHRAAAVHVEDRGYQFADGVYEVMAVKGGRLLDEAGHLDRLERSLAELRMAAPMRRAPLAAVLREVVRRNRVEDGIVYLQVTRGVAPRDHAFPKRPVPPSLVVTARRQKAKLDAMAKGVAVVTVPDIRWRRRDIKTVGLTANVLAKQQATEAGAYEAWLVEEGGRVTEGSSTNAWIVTRDKVIVTRRADRDILNGITRLALLGLGGKAGYRFEERAFTVAEAQGAAEAFITSATSWVIPVVKIDERWIGNGAPGSVTLALQALYVEGTAGA
jgi:D-alanine transaminase